jgi:hypothetical protein
MNLSKTSRVRLLGASLLISAASLAACADDTSVAPETNTRVSWATSPRLAAAPGNSALPPGYYKAPGKKTIYLVVAGAAWAIPDAETYWACTTGWPSLVQTTEKLSLVRVAGTIPSTNSNAQLHAGTPFQLSGSSDKTVYMVSGCLRAGIPSPAVYQGIYGDQNYRRVISVSPSVFNAFPAATSVAVAPRYAPGTLIQGSRSEVRWVFGPGMSFGVPNPYVLSTHIRPLSPVRVSDATFNAYARVATLPLACPTYWTTLRSGKGVVQCSGVFIRGTGHAAELDYAEIADLTSGARVKMLFAAQAGATTASPSPNFTRRSVTEWRSSLPASARPFCVVNGAYFDWPISGKLALPLTSNGVLVTAGKDATNYTRARLVFTATGVQIKAYQLNANSLSGVGKYLTEPTAVVGHYRNDNDAFARVGRQYVAIRDNDRDGVGDVMILYTSSYASTGDINSTLAQVFGVGVGAYDAMQFDGGGSTQLVCGSGADGSAAQSYTANSRTVPHALAMYEAP